MSADDFSIHTEDCPAVGDGMPLSDLPDEVTSIEDLDCECWSEYDSLDEISEHLVFLDTLGGLQWSRSHWRGDQKNPR